MFTIALRDQMLLAFHFFPFFFLCLSPNSPSINRRNELEEKNQFFSFSPSSHSPFPCPSSSSFPIRVVSLMCDKLQVASLNLWWKCFFSTLDTLEGDKKSLSLAWGSMGNFIPTKCCHHSLLLLLGHSGWPAKHSLRSNFVQLLGQKETSLHFILFDHPSH